MPYIIAEAGVNHNGDPKLAHKLIDAAAYAGADAIKFQTFKAEALVTKNAPKAGYQKENTGNDDGQFEMLKSLELDRSDYFSLYEHAKKLNIAFLSTPFDIDSLRFLTDDLGLNTLKIPSGEITNAPLLFEASRKVDKIILSTGISNLEEIEAALSIIAWASVCPDKKPNEAEFEKVLNSPKAQERLKEHVTLLHCTTAYPAPPETVNLKAMHTIHKKFGLAYGLSDHSEGTIIPVAAVAMGAMLIEKHFTLDRFMEGPDHRASLEPEELKKMVTDIRLVRVAMGSGEKKPADAERANAYVVRKTLVAAASISKGELFTERNVTTKRPANGLSPFKYWDLLGTPADRDYDEDEPLYVDR